MMNQKHQPKEISNRQQLLDVIKDLSSLLTIADVCDAVAADARFSAWIFSIERKINPEQFMELLNKYEPLTDLCSVAIEEFRKNHEEAIFREAICGITRQIIDLTGEKMR